MIFNNKQKLKLNTKKLNQFILTSLIFFISLATYGKNIISLTPHITEILFAIGAGNKIIAIDNYSDYPDATKNIIKIGDFHNLDLEKIISLKPDLIIAWQSSNKKQVTQLQKLGFKVFLSNAKTFNDVAYEIKELGKLTNNIKNAEKVANDFLTKINNLKNKYKHKQKVSVFYQIWHKPLMTIGSKQIINQAINICGANNIFTALAKVTYQIDIELVLAKNPDVIIMNESQLKHSFWHKFSDFNKKIITVSDSLLARMGPRLQDGVKELCEKLDYVRKQI